MTRLFTEIERGALGIRCSLADHIVLLGSCFADNIGSRMHDAGFDVTVNPFGTLYNPLSLLRAVRRLDAAAQYGPDDCVPMGAGAGLVCSFEHHTSFARPTAEEFLTNANAALEHSRATWKACNKVIITLGTAFVWEHTLFGNTRHHAAGATGFAGATEFAGATGATEFAGAAGTAGATEFAGAAGTAGATGFAGATEFAGAAGFGAVANCLKRPAAEFLHRRLSVQECADALAQIVAAHPEKDFIFTVSPIRHLSQGAHENTLSKATLHLALEQLTRQADGQIAGRTDDATKAGQAADGQIAGRTDNATKAAAVTKAGRIAYFPAWEILCDQLRDYRFYDEDLVHPSKTAVDIIWEHFLNDATVPGERQRIEENLRESRRQAHRPLH